MSHAQGYPFHAGSSSSSSFDSQVPSYREHTPSLESDRTNRSSLEQLRESGASSYSPRHSRRYSQRRQLSPAERAVSAHYAAMASGAPAPTPPQDVHDPMRVRHDALGRFFGEQFGAAAPSSSQQQQMPSHYRTQSQARREVVHEEAPVPQYASQGRGRSAPVPPPYDSRTDVESLPVYTKESAYDAELNRKLFIYGFRESLSYLHPLRFRKILTRFFVP